MFYKNNNMTLYEVTFSQKYFGIIYACLFTFTKHLCKVKWFAIDSSNAFHHLTIIICYSLEFCHNTKFPKIAISETQIWDSWKRKMLFLEHRQNSKNLLRWFKIFTKPVRKKSPKLLPCNVEMSQSLKRYFENLQTHY